MVVLKREFTWNPDDLASHLIPVRCRTHILTFNLLGPTLKSVYPWCLSHFEPGTLLLQFYILDPLHLSTKSLHPQTISVDLPFPRSGISFSALPWKTRRKRLGQDQDLQRRAQSQTLRQDPVSTQKSSIHPSKQIPFLERLARPCQKRATRFQGEAVLQ